MQYNESLYNGDSYNLTNYTTTLLESITPSDATVLKDLSIVRTDSQGTADVLSDGVSLAAILDTVTIFQRARTPFAYNNGTYNQFIYNARFDEDEILLMATKYMIELLELDDDLQPFEISKVFLETITGTDLLLKSQSLSLADFVFFSQFFQIQVTNKALNETLRTADWLSIERSPVNNEWSD